MSKRGSSITNYTPFQTTADQSPNSGSDPFESSPDVFYFRVCRRYQDGRTSEYNSHKRNQLKEKICEQLSLVINPMNLSLSTYDIVKKSWSIIDNTDRPRTTSEKDPSSPVTSINIEKLDQTSPSATTDKLLTLKLCRYPKNRTDYIIIYIQASKTIGQCREQAQEHVKNQRTDNLYRWDANGWEKLDRGSDDVTLAELAFLSGSFISFEPSNESIPGVCGLTNLGNTCFMNSALQCLSHIPQLTKEVLRLGKDINAPTIGAYIALIKTLWSGECRVTTPSSLLLNIRDSLPRFTRYRQHDAQEFMSYFLRLIHEELTNEQTLISELFHGTMQSKVKCQGGCHSTETIDETFTFLPLPVDRDTNQYSILFLRSNGEKRQVTVRSQTKDIGMLVSAFIDQCEPKLSARDIRPVRLSEQKIVHEYASSDRIYDMARHQLALIEMPAKTVYQCYVELAFYDRTTRQPFRPSLFLVRPSYGCRYSDLIEQIDRIRSHLYSSSEDQALALDKLHWINSIGETRRLQSEADDLFLIKRIIIEVDGQWTIKYRERNQMPPALADKPSLDKLLADFFGSAPLDGDYYCSRCESLQSARHKAELFPPLPPVLIIQLKRFTYEQYSNEKIDTHIEFPLENLDLSEYMAKSDQSRSQPRALYRLVAVSNHTGSLTSGHYVTYGLNDRNQRWYSFNDERVEEISDVVTKNAYILIYVKQ